MRFIRERLIREERIRPRVHGVAWLIEQSTLDALLTDATERHGVDDIDRDGLLEEHRRKLRRYDPCE